jgi:hypothetical protein
MVMNSEDEMDTPVTRREMHEELSKVREDFAKHREEVREDFAKHREEVRQQFVEQRTWLAQYADDILSRHSKAMMEYLQSLIGPVDDKYSSLPKRTDELETTVADLSPRVTTLERKVFAPPKRRPAKRASRRR